MEHPVIPVGEDLEADADRFELVFIETLGEHRPYSSHYGGFNYVPLRAI